MKSDKNIFDFNPGGGHFMAGVYLKWFDWIENIIDAVFHRRKNRKPTFEFNPETQIAVIRSSVCSGEKVAGFKSKIDNSFVEVMAIRNDWDKQDFLKAYNLEDVGVEYA